MSAEQPDEAQILAEIVRRVLTVTDPDKIILFGSRARGDARPDSDYDILVIGPSDEMQSRRTAPLYLGMRGLGAPKDLVWWTPAEVERWLPARSHFINRVMREGRVLYER